MQSTVNSGSLNMVETTGFSHSIFVILEARILHSS